MAVPRVTPGTGKISFASGARRLTGMNVVSSLIETILRRPLCSRDAGSPTTWAPERARRAKHERNRVCAGRLRHRSAPFWLGQPSAAARCRRGPGSPASGWRCALAWPIGISSRRSAGRRRDPVRLPSPGPDPYRRRAPPGPEELRVPESRLVIVIVGTASASACARCTSSWASPWRSARCSRPAPSGGPTSSYGLVSVDWPRAVVLRLPRPPDPLGAGDRGRARARDGRERAAIARSAFLAKVSHELRSPLQGIVSALDVIEMRHVAAGGRRGADRPDAAILDAAEHAAARPADLGQGRGGPPADPRRAVRSMPLVEAWPMTLASSPARRACSS